MDISIGAYVEGFIEEALRPSQEEPDPLVEYFISRLRHTLAYSTLPPKNSWSMCGVPIPSHIWEMVILRIVGETWELGFEAREAVRQELANWREEGVRWRALQLLQKSYP